MDERVVDRLLLQELGRQRKGIVLGFIIIHGLQTREKNIGKRTLFLFSSPRPATHVDEKVVLHLDVQHVLSRYPLLAVLRRGPHLQLEIFQIKLEV